MEFESKIHHNIGLNRYDTVYRYNDTVYRSLPYRTIIKQKYTSLPASLTLYTGRGLAVVVVVVVVVVVGGGVVVVVVVVGSRVVVIGSRAAV